MSKAKIALYGIAASGFFIASTALYAAPAPVERTATVQFGDLNLDKRGDVAELYQRIRTAADLLCRSRVGIYDTLHRYQGCVADALQKVVVDVNRASLTEFYREQLTPDRSIEVAKQ